MSNLIKEEQRARELIKHGELVAAIKLIRDSNNFGLVESKNLVEQWHSELRGEKSAGLKFLIWSNEHKSWWAPNWNGYTADRNAAGRYSLYDAMKIVTQANYAPESLNNPNEAMVPDITN